MGLGERDTHGAGRTSLAVAAIVVGGAAAIGGAWAADAAAAVPVVNCKTRSQVIPPARNPGRIPAWARRQSVFAGPVMFSGARSWSDPDSELSDGFSDEPGRLRPVKVPIVVNAGSAIRVTISPPAGRRARIRVGRDRRPATRGRKVELRPCHPSARVSGNRVGRRTPFLNAFRIDGQMCLRVKVKVKGRPEPYFRRIGFGPRACERPIALTGSEGSYPTRCTPARIATRLEGFVRALQQVDARALRRYWGWRGFERFSVLRGERRMFVARSYARGLERLRRRGGLRMRIEELEVGPPGRRIKIAFEGTFRTKGGDVTNLSATGWVACRRLGIARMSVRVGAEVPDVANCAAPSEATPEGAMVVCTRAAGS